MLNSTIKRTAALALVLGAVLVSSGCTSVGASGYSHAPAAQIGVVQHPRVNGGVIPQEAYDNIAGLESKSCQDQVFPQTAGPLQAAGTGGVQYGLAGAVGVGQGAAKAFATAATPYRWYGGIAGAANGVVSGLNQGSITAGSAVAECQKNFWELDKRTRFNDEGPQFNSAKYQGTFVVPIPMRAWGNPKPPKLDRSPEAKPASKPEASPRK